MSLSSFCVVSNALRLNLFKLYNCMKDKKMAAVNIQDVVDAMRPAEEPETSALMHKIYSIEGMMCGHCEKMVKKALEKMPQVDEAATNWQAGTADVWMHEEVSEDEVKAVVEKAGYEYIGIKSENA